MSHLTEFEGRPLQSVAQGDLDLGTLAEASDSLKQQDSETEYTPLLERMQQALGPRTERVRLTTRLTDSPACLVSDHGPSMNLERMLKEAGQAVPSVQPVMEINPEHPIVRRLKSEADDQRFADWTLILFDQALLAEGGKLDDPAGFVKRLNELMLAMAGAEPSRIWTPGS